MMDAETAEGAPSCLHDWPLDLVRLIITQLPDSQLSSLRLVSSSFAVCIDPSITALHVSSLQAWRSTPTGPLRPCNVERIDVSTVELRKDHWQALQRVSAQLPNLSHIRVHSRIAASHALPTCVAALSNITRLDLPSAVFDVNLPADLQLPALRAASFGVVLGTAQLAAFAPQLQQLFCKHMQVAMHGHNTPMPSITHFGGSRVFYRASNTAEAATAASTAAAAAAATAQELASRSPAFPHLRVLFKLPQGVSYNNYDGIAELAPTTSLQAIRGVGRFRGTKLWSLLAQQQHLQQLSLHDEWGMSGFQGISCLTQLQQLRLTGSCSGENASLVLEQVQQLPQLQALLLPAELLCRRCCPDVGASLAALGSKSSITRLVFVQLQPRFDCPHVESRQEGLEHITVTATTAAASAAAGAGQEACDPGQQQKQDQAMQQPQQLQQQQHQLRQQGAALSVEVLIEERKFDEPPWKCSHSSNSDSIWGVYGPPAGL